MNRAGGQSVTLACPAMGTRFELLLRGDDAVALRSAGEAAIEEVLRWHNLLNAFDRASVVSRLNREAAEQWVTVPSEVAALLSWCIEVSSASHGAFNPAVGHLMLAAGFRGAPRIEGVGPRRGAKTLAGLADAVELDAHSRVCFKNRGVSLDFGAVGKGWALDRAAEVLRELGVADALFHGGTSSIVTVGRTPYRVALAEENGTVVELADSALGLSAPSGRQITGADGSLRGHVLDPRTGRSASSLAGAAVTGPSAAACDAWSTALLVQPSLAHSASWPRGYAAYTAEPHAGWSVSHNPQTTKRPAHPAADSCLQGSVH